MEEIFTQAAPYQLPSGLISIVDMNKCMFSMLNEQQVECEKLLAMHNLQVLA